MSTDEQAPSQITGQLKQAQGVLYQAVGAVPGTAESWTAEGERLQKEGADELDEARAEQKGEATVNRVWGKAESAYGMVTGDQTHLNEGNLKAEKGEWQNALADGQLPNPSWDRVKGKAQSAAGMLTGDQEMQKDGNMQAEKAEWTKG